MPVGDNDNEQRQAPDSHAWPPPTDDVVHFAQRALLDADGTAIVIMGFDGSVKTANSAALRLLGAKESPFS